MVEIALSYLALAGVVSGSLMWLIKSTYRASIYLAEIRDSLSDLNSNMQRIEAKTEHFNSRLSDIERYLTKNTDFTPRNY